MWRETLSAPVRCCRPLECFLLVLLLKTRVINISFGELGFIPHTLGVAAAGGDSACVPSTCSVRSACACGSTGRRRVPCAARSAWRPCAAGRMAPPLPTSRCTDSSTAQPAHSSSSWRAPGSCSVLLSLLLPALSQQDNCDRSETLPCGAGEVWGVLWVFLELAGL